MKTWFDYQQPIFVLSVSAGVLFDGAFFLWVSLRRLLSNFGSEMHEALAIASLVTANSSSIFSKRLLILRLTKRIFLAL